MSITPVSSAGLPIFNTNPRPSSVVIVTFWSRSLTSGDATPLTPKTSAAVRSASRGVNAGGGASSGSGSPAVLVMSAAMSRHGSTTLDNRTSPPRAAAAVIDQEEAEAARFSSYIVAVASSIAR